MSTCIRGCVRVRRLPDGTLDEAPVGASHGLLCERCHALLWDALTGVEKQVAALREDVEPSTSRPTDNDGRSGGEVWPEALRLSCLDMARLLEDTLSELLDAVCEDYRIRPPERAMTGHERDGAMRRRVMLGELAWVDPPVRFELATAAAWLRENIVRIESRGAVGDELEHLAEIMSRAHALAPWRWPSEPLRGIPCPSCHRMRVHFFPHGEALSDDPQRRAGVAKCLACEDMWEWGRWLMWARMYEAGEVARHDTHAP